MNDDELITAVKDSFTGVHASTPVEQIISRSHAARGRRRIPAMAGVLAVAAATALSVTALLPAGHQSSRQPTARLAAWTVVRQADGTIDVTISELSDPAGLQSTLRADGVPASVTFAGVGQWNPACQPYPSDDGKWMREVIHRLGRPNFLAIDPSALPGGAGLQIGTRYLPNAFMVAVSLVQASQQCTGS